MDAASGVAGILWWIAVGGMFLAVIPLLLFIAHRLYGTVREVKDYAEDIQVFAGNVAGNLEAVPALHDTRDKAQRVQKHLSEYVTALGRRL